MLGGHIDSWDVGAGASDDGVGCIVTWEALRLMKKLGVSPRRTVRLVLWTNEENGTARRRRLRGEVRVDGDEPRLRARVRFGRVRARALRLHRQPRGAKRDPRHRVSARAARPGRDRSRAAAGQTSIRSPRPAACRRWRTWGTRRGYFTIHHTPADTVERIAPEEVSKAAAAIAVVAYVVAEMPERLPK